MKKLLILTFLFIPGLVSAYRHGEPGAFSRKLSQAAIERTNHIVRYDGSYRKISYPNGDVPDNVGVCTDLVIRSYRKLGIDLQKDIHVDMRENFALYPKLWGLSKPDPNIDHRRVPNLQTLFNRKGIVLPVTFAGYPRKPPPVFIGYITWPSRANCCFLPSMSMIR